MGLDDFGTGYGSFRYLKHLPVNVLKVDQEFVRDLEGETSVVNRYVIEATVTLARGMRQKTVTEGVETESVPAIIRELGVDYAQGYLFARPAPAEDLLPWDQQSLDQEQALLDREVHAGGDDPGGDAEQQARQAEARLAQTRRAASQDRLDDPQRARDEHQALLDDQQADLDAPSPIPDETSAQAERRRANQLLARADAMDARAQDAARRASDARRRAHAALERTEAID